MLESDRSRANLALLAPPTGQQVLTCLRWNGAEIIFTTLLREISAKWCQQRSPVYELVFFFLPPYGLFPSPAAPPAGSAWD